MRARAGPALIPASHNYPGFKGIAGPDFLARLRDQARLYGASHGAWPRHHTAAKAAARIPRALARQGGCGADRAARDRSGR